MGRTPTLIDKSCPGCGKDFQTTKSDDRKYCKNDCYLLTQTSQKNAITVVPVQPPQKQEKSKSVTKVAQEHQKSPALRLLAEAETELNKLVVDGGWDGWVRKYAIDTVAVVVPIIVAVAIGSEVAKVFGGDWPFQVMGYGYEGIIAAVAYVIIGLRIQRNSLPVDRKEVKDNVEVDVKFGYLRRNTVQLLCLVGIWFVASVPSAVMQYWYLKGTAPTSIIDARVAGLTLADMFVAFGVVRFRMSAQELADKKLFAVQAKKRIALANIEVAKVEREIIAIYHEEMGNTRVNTVEEVQ